MRRSALAMLAAGCCLLAHGAAAQETDQDAIVRDLLSHDFERIRDALERLPLVYIHDAPPGGAHFEFPKGFEPTTELVEALVTAYDRTPNGELRNGLRKPLIATRHPLTIDVLTRTLYTGNAAKDGLLYFGPSVLPGVVDLAMSPEATPNEATGAMSALKAAVERWDGELGPEIRGAMKEAAILHLEGAPDSFASAGSHMSGFLFDDAVALAEVLRDPELTAIAYNARHPSTGKPGAERGSPR
ncbi:MAG: hypothetical protein J4F34_06955 [Gemmatimonadetes bacterium]|nr:hypothetical protein [Gemmatimonadota bacterium]